MNCQDSPAWDARVAAFVLRRFHCHRCGRTGEQTRTTDPSPTGLRFSLPGGHLLLPRCEDCATAAPDDGARAERDLYSAIDRSGPAISPVPLDTYRCSVAVCAVLWHELAARPPAVPVYDEAEQIARHPCPWCLADRPHTSRTDHLELAERLHRPPA